MNYVLRILTVICSCLKVILLLWSFWLHLCLFGYTCVFLLHLCFLVTPVFVGFFVNVLWIIFFKRHKLMNSRIYFKQNYALRISTRRFYVIFLTPGEIAVCLKVALIGLFSRRYPLHESMEGQQKHGFYCCFMRWCRARGARKCFVFSRYRRNMSSLWCAWCEGLWSSRYLAEQFEFTKCLVFVWKETLTKCNFVCLYYINHENIGFLIEQCGMNQVVNHNEIVLKWRWKNSTEYNS